MIKTSQVADLIENIYNGLTFGVFKLYKKFKKVLAITFLLGKLTSMWNVMVEALLLGLARWDKVRA